MLFRLVVVCLCGLGVLFSLSQEANAGQPNVIVIVSDDQGWSDVGFNGCKEIPTPHLDALAESGVVFDAGYASHPYCSPSRAGLLTGRYQQRFGHECNPGAHGDDDASETEGLPLSETLLPSVLKQAGYRTGAIGKWHLGDSKQFWPTERGFDEWFGFSGGGLSYWGDLGKKPPLHGVLRNGEVVPKDELTYLTDDFSTEAVKFVENNRDKPFFLYLAYNAPHAPDQVTREHLKKTEHIEYGGRAVYGAMVAAMDEGIGRVVQALKDQNLQDDTLIFFYSDNGGRATLARNFPYRGHKGMLFEGGIRVPFCVSWPEQIQGGRRYENPITALDIFPTALAAAGVDSADNLKLDGVNLLPYLAGNKNARPHDQLFWRYACGNDVFGYAVREGDWKLVYSVYKGKHLLFDLKADPWERNDLAEQHPEHVQKLTALYRDWDEELLDPLWLDPHGVNVHKEHVERQSILDRATRGEK
ncbi:sulfatase [Rubinisphaera sp. JC750]|uniref:sulfatase n=1 Tax=Rubinisphaera sp. JC750 TaxID=2898658 RepID=UPI001F17D0EF|nr:sulfatase [Rubinisphaera sp. JC750]